MRKIAAGSFKSNFLALMDEVQAKHETVLITKHGKPVAMLVPVNTGTNEIYNFLTMLSHYKWNRFNCVRGSASSKLSAI